MLNLLVLSSFRLARMHRLINAFTFVVNFPLPNLLSNFSISSGDRSILVVEFPITETISNSIGICATSPRSAAFRILITVSLNFLSGRNFFSATMSASFWVSLTLIFILFSLSFFVVFIKWLAKTPIFKKNTTEFFEIFFISLIRYERFRLRFKKTITVCTRGTDRLLWEYSI